MDTTLVIMAAGIGSRFGTGIKQLEPVGPSGEIIMDYSIHDAMEAGFNQVVFILRKEIEEDFKEIIGKRIEKLLPVSYAYQEVEDVPTGFDIHGRTKPWGTVQAVLCAREVVKTPFIVINADDYYGKEAFQKMHQFLVTLDPNQVPMKWAMAGFSLQNTMSENGGVNRGVCKVDEDGYLLEVVETKEITQEGEVAHGFVDEQDVMVPLDVLVSMNVWALTPDIFPLLEERFHEFLEEWNPEQLKAEYLLPTFIDQMLKEKKANVKVLETNDHWFGVTYKEDKELVVSSFQALIEQGVYQSPLN